MLKKIFAVVRPYDDRFRTRVFEFLNSLGFTTTDELILPRKTPDEEARAWIKQHQHKINLLLLPYHQHRDVDDNLVDGINVASLLPSNFGDRKIPILMPVTDFAFAASFPRRFEVLELEKPEICKMIVVMSPDQIGTSQISDAIEEILDSK